MKWPVIYALRHNQTGKIYVGFTEDIADRIYNHVLALKSGRHPSLGLQYDYDTHGKDLSFCILAECPVDNRWACRQMESLYMSLLDSRNPEKGYNQSDPSGAFDIENAKFYLIPETPRKSELDPRKRNANLPAQYNIKDAHSRFYLARVKAGYYGTEVAAALGVNRKTVNRWDRGLDYPRGDQIIRAAKLFGVEPSELLQEPPHDP